MKQIIKNMRKKKAPVLKLMLLICEKILFFLSFAGAFLLAFLEPLS
jgi:hypothetical protein